MFTYYKQKFKIIREILVSQVKRSVSSGLRNMLEKFRYDNVRARFYNLDLTITRHYFCVDIFLNLSYVLIGAAYIELN
jgi:hypothetical protein